MRLSSGRTCAGSVGHYRVEPQKRRARDEGVGFIVVVGQRVQHDGDFGRARQNGAAAKGFVAVRFLRAAQPHVGLNNKNTQEM